MDIHVIPLVAQIRHAINRTANEAKKKYYSQLVLEDITRDIFFFFKGQIKVVEPRKASLLIHESSSKIANPLFPMMQS